MWNWGKIQTSVIPLLTQGHRVQEDIWHTWWRRNWLCRRKHSWHLKIFFPYIPFLFFPLLVPGTVIQCKTSALQKDFNLRLKNLYWKLFLPGKMLELSFWEPFWGPCVYHLEPPPCFVAILIPVWDKNQNTLHCILVFHMCIHTHTLHLCSVWQQYFKGKSFLNQYSKRIWK